MAQSVGDLARLDRDYPGPVEFVANLDAPAHGSLVEPRKRHARRVADDVVGQVVPRPGVEEAEHQFRLAVAGEVGGLDADRQQLADELVLERQVGQPCAPSLAPVDDHGAGLALDGVATRLDDPDPGPARHLDPPALDGPRRIGQRTAVDVGAGGLVGWGTSVAAGTLVKTAVGSASDDLGHSLTTANIAAEASSMPANTPAIMAPHSFIR